MSGVMNGISPMYLGATRPIASIHLQDTSGAPPPTLAGATFVLTIHDTTGALPDRIGRGTFTIIGATTGDINYTWDATDTAIPGNFEVQVTVTFADGGILPYKPVPWTVDTLNQ